MHGITDPIPVLASLRDKRLPQVSNEHHISIDIVGTNPAGGEPCRKMEWRLSRSSDRDARGGVERQGPSFGGIFANVLCRE